MQINHFKSKTVRKKCIAFFVSIDDYFIPSRPFLLSILFQMLLETLKAQEAVEHNGLQIKTTPFSAWGSSHYCWGEKHVLFRDGSGPDKVGENK